MTAYAIVTAVLSTAVAASADAASFTISSTLLSNADDITQPLFNGGFVGPNYYTDNDNFPGQTFTTGSNTVGYNLDSVSVRVLGKGNTTAATAYELSIWSVSGTSKTFLYSEVFTSPAAVANGDYLTFSVSTPVALLAGGLYGYSFDTASADNAYLGLDVFEGTDGSEGPYADGRAAAFKTPIDYGVTKTDATFNIGLTAIPEPASLALLAFGGLMLASRKR